MIAIDAAETTGFAWSYSVLEGSEHHESALTALALRPILVENESLYLSHGWGRGCLVY